ncbi:tyrosine-protein phosphatase [Novosphingobium soli]|uniref:Tyrosine-protein phosphatase n=1 Tax=Novosphingobium soli TaxID=574956 RepID=A0ABV6CYQ1_9SPHN
MKHYRLLAGLPLAALTSVSAWAGTVTDMKVERAAPDKLVVRWSDADPVDVLQADRPDAAPGEARLVSGKDADGRFEATVTPGTRPYFLLRDSRTGTVSRVAERVLPLEQGSNFRDIGGYPAAGGKHVRWGVIFRSGGQPMLTEADVSEIKALGIVNLIDLRSDEERVLAPTRLDGIRYNAVGYSMAPMLAGIGQGVSQAPAAKAAPSDALKGLAEGYRRFPVQLAPQVRLVFDRLLGKEGPVLYNCSAGQDRTGFVSAMVLSALGVQRETIYADYLLSTPSRRPQWELPPITEAQAKGNPIAGMFARFQNDPAHAKPNPLVTADGTPFLANAFAEIDSRYGSAEGYLKQEIGLNDADLASLRSTYLE